MSFSDTCAHLVALELEIGAGTIPEPGKLASLHDRFVATTQANDPGEERAVLVNHEGIFYALLLADGVVHLRRLVMPIDLGVPALEPVDAVLSKPGD